MSVNSIRLCAPRKVLHGNLFRFIAAIVAELHSANTIGNFEDIGT